MDINNVRKLAHPINEKSNQPPNELTSVTRAPVFVRTDIISVSIIVFIQRTIINVSTDRIFIDIIFSVFWAGVLAIDYAVA